MKLLSVLFAASCAARAGAERTQEAHKLKPGAADASLLVGTATRDCTGPSTEYLFMGMANRRSTARASGRASSPGPSSSSATAGAVAFVSADNAMIGHVLKSRVLAKVGDALGDNATYTYENVVLSGTHTHSAASGFLQHVIFQLAGGYLPRPSTRRRRLAAKFADLSSRIRVAHAFVEMPGRAVVDWETGAPLENSATRPWASRSPRRPGQFDFSQNSTSPNPLWKLAARVLHKSTPAQAACQAPKTILIPTGSMSPDAWAPPVLPCSSSTSAACGRRADGDDGQRVKRMLRAKFGENAAVVVAGLSNEYADYTATFEEYQAQRYEGGSTIYGRTSSTPTSPSSRTSRTPCSAATRRPGPMPADFSADIWAWGEKQPSEETPPDGANFGDQLAASWDAAARNLTASFVGGDLKHDLKHGGTYLEVQRAAGDGWATVFVDGDPETRIRLAVVKHGFLDRHHYLNATMSAELADAGTYRVLYHGNAYVDGKVVAFTGTSANATVV
ncbi:ceramidase [Aureococcus anophagefferens]|nr:ceramidase [Aureococcus anophagefferens]